MIRDFGEELRFSHSLSDAPWWETVYRRAFVDFRAMVDLREDGWHQRAGRDRAVVLSTGRALYIDEKGRREDWPDVLIEVWSQYPKGPRRAAYPRTPGAVEGWSRKPLDCDYLAYAFVQSEICYLFPYLGIRQAVHDNAQKWIEQAKTNFALRESGQRASGITWIHAQNKRYDTISFGIPPRVLWEAVSGSLTVSWRVGQEAA